MKLTFSLSLAIFIVVHLHHKYWSTHAIQITDPENNSDGNLPATDYSNLPKLRILESFVATEGNVCAYACDAAAVESSNEKEVDATESSSSLFGRILNVFHALVDDSESFFQRLVNFFRRIPSIRLDRTIPTSMILPALSDGSLKLKSLINELRYRAELTSGPDNEVSTDSANMIMSLYNLSADNLESFSLILEPVLDEMRPYERMDVAQMLCLLGQLLRTMTTTTIPNIMSMADLIGELSSNAPDIQLTISEMTSEYKSAMQGIHTNTNTNAGTSTLSTQGPQCGMASNGYDGNNNRVGTNIATMRNECGLIGVLLDAPATLLKLVLLTIAFPLSFLIPIFSPIIILFAAFFDTIFEFEEFEVDSEYISLLFIAPVYIGLVLLVTLFQLSQDTEDTNINFEAWNSQLSQMSITTEDLVGAIQQKVLLHQQQSSATTSSNEERDAVNDDDDMDCGSKMLSCQTNEFSNTLSFLLNDDK